ncbi:flightin isoform X1 [Euwallacea similis]|uniref:flightin isoform X1 n=1 Tax=Euwallacea similis TaxID=1736056 RepID=UPI00344E71F6
MDDDGADWLSAADEPEPEPVAAAPAAADAAPAAEAAPEGAAPAEDPASKGVEPVEAADEYLDPDKLLLFKHWIRPKYLQYNCIYDYRKSYYEDVLAAVESRRKGYRRNIPRAQTWAERVLRSHSSPSYKVQAFDQFLEDLKLVTRTEVSRRLYASQSLANFNRRYTSRL